MSTDDFALLKIVRIIFQHLRRTTEKRRERRRRRVKRKRQRQTQDRHSRGRVLDGDPGQLGGRRHLERRRH